MDNAERIEAVILHWRSAIIGIAAEPQRHSMPVLDHAMNQLAKAVEMRAYLAGGQALVALAKHNQALEWATKAIHFEPTTNDVVEFPDGHLEDVLAVDVASLSDLVTTAGHPFDMIPVYLHDEANGITRILRCSAEVYE